MAYFRSGISNIQKFKGTAVDVTDLPAPIASFRSNASGVKLDSLKVLVEAVQSGSGTPSPDNVRPITGWSGANVTRTGTNQWDEEWELGIINTTTGENQASSTQIRSVNHIPVKPNTTYRLVTSTSWCAIEAYRQDKSFLQNLGGVTMGSTFTVPADCYYIRFYCSPLYGTTYNNDISINYPSTDTAYHAYNGNTYTISFGDTYYGGELDVTNGVLRVIRQIEDMGNLNYTKYDVAEGTLFRTQISGAKLEYNVDNLLCSAYHFALKEQRANGTYSIPDNVGNLDFINNSYSDATAFKTAMAGQELVYELATPFTVQLTPQQIEQLEENNIWADTGDVSECRYIQISQIGG